MCRLLHLLLAVVLAGLAGCQTRGLVGEWYNPPLAKCQAVLELMRDGTYSYAQHGSAREVEYGRWWQIEKNVVLLVPNNLAQAQWFARIERKGLIESQIEASSDIRILLPGCEGNETRRTRPNSP